jgi:hypothetical protein
VPDADPDGDGIRNAMEYALGTNPKVSSTLTWNITKVGADTQVSYQLSAVRPDVGYFIQKTSVLGQGSWGDLATAISGVNPTYQLAAVDTAHDAAAFYRLVVVLYNQ